MSIKQFKNEHHFLSNFSNHDINYKGLNFPTVEHFFQAMKSNNFKNDVNLFLESKEPIEAKKLGKKIELRQDWEHIKDFIMFIGVFKKFNKHQEIKEKLIKTSPQFLIEGNFWHDNYWGNCTCNKCKEIYGLNKLGNILMIIRSKLIFNEEVNFIK